MIKGKTVSILALVSGILLFGSSAQAVNVLSNASFETPDASGGDVGCTPSFSCTSWFGFESAFINSNLFDDGQRGPLARTGTQIAKMFGPFNGNSTSGMFQDIAANPGEIWGASAYIQNWDDPDGTTGGDPMQGDNIGQLLLIFQDSAGSDLLTVTDEFDAGQPRNVWTLLSATGTAPEGTANVRFFLAHQQQESLFDGGSIFWDDASLEVVPVPAAVWLFGSALGLMAAVRRRISQ